jgi:hypothetical protein
MSQSSKLSHRKYLERTAKILKYTKANMARLGIDQALVNDVYVVRHMRYEILVEKCEDKATRTHMDIVNRNLARKDLEEVESQIEGLLKNLPGVSEADLAEMNIATGTGGGHPYQPGTEMPLLKADTSVPTLLILIIRLLTGKRGKPIWADRVELAIGIMGAAADDHDSDPYRVAEFVIDADKLPFRIQDSNGKEVIELKAHQSGLKALVAGRYVTREGKHGPWTKILVITIP